MEIKPIVYKGAREICAAVGVNWKEISYYVIEKKMPAFKIDGKGSWIALPKDLEKWVEKQRDKNLKKKTLKKPCQPLFTILFCHIGPFFVLF